MDINCTSCQDVRFSAPATTHCYRRRFSLVVMKCFIFSFAIIWLLQLVRASEYVELEPIPRHLWDKSIQKRDDAAQAAEPANITLGDHEQVLWTNPPNSELCHPCLNSS